VQNTKTKLAFYIESTKQVLSELKIIAHDSVRVDEKRIKDVVDSAKRYWNDAKYFQERNRFEVGLVSVAYCEGMLDALRLLKVVRFSWPNKKEKRKEELF
jgi:hypothetical protein